ncbi:hypothetical protein BCR34DRAFT_292685 [Clohesyomyces aquaticus]|uniref:Uncharacterized protein n=1 Tax=Clohesyomyces aquaticus TaxID=1231657 RepID=A0A1Y2A896_9PLEO|nr:hypothetical protein BCR34DRAFT_292685 [Clohesyomyces aquaticus]
MFLNLDSANARRPEGLAAYPGFLTGGFGPSTNNAQHFNTIFGPTARKHTSTRHSLELHSSYPSPPHSLQVPLFSAMEIHRPKAPTPITQMRKNRSSGFAMVPPITPDPSLGCSPSDLPVLVITPATQSRPSSTHTQCSSTSSGGIAISHSTTPPAQVRQESRGIIYASQIRTQNTPSAPQLRPVDRVASPASTEFDFEKNVSIPALERNVRAKLTPEYYFKDGLSDTWAKGTPDTAIHTSGKGVSQGPSSAVGPSAAGPPTAGSSTAGPSTAGLSTANKGPKGLTLHPNRPIQSISSTIADWHTARTHLTRRDSPRSGDIEPSISASSLRSFVTAPSQPIRLPGIEEDEEDGEDPVEKVGVCRGCWICWLKVKMKKTWKTLKVEFERKKPRLLRYKGWRKLPSDGGVRPSSDESVRPQNDESARPPNHETIIQHLSKTM